MPYSSAGRTSLRPPSLHRWLVAAIGAAGFFAWPVAAQAQMFTMNGECRDRVAAATGLNETGAYDQAVAAFDALLADCRTVDARELAHVGRAHAYNQMGQADAAIAAANDALDARDESLYGLFERAYAHEQKGDMAAAGADYDQIIQLTEKNEHVTERATLYAKVADMYARAGKSTEANANLSKAVELDPNNPDFQIMRGDWAVKAGDSVGAFAAYDQAMAMGKNDTEMYTIRTEAAIKLVQDKYDTTNAQELRREMSDAETEQVCAEIQRAVSSGLEDMQLDIFSALVCR